MKPFNIWDLEYMATRFNPLPTNDDFLDYRYQWQMTRNGAEWPYYRFFYHLSKMLQPNLIVELGGWQGTAASHFAAGWDKGKVITTDHHTDPGDNFNKRKMAEAEKRYANLSYIQGWSNPELAAREYDKHELGNAPSALSKVKLENKKIDVLFVDSWHNYIEAIMDWEAYKPLLNSPSLVICDDIQEGETDGSPVSGMMRFWREMPEPKFLNKNLHPGTMMGFVYYEENNV